MTIALFARRPCRQSPSPGGGGSTAGAQRSEARRSGGEIYARRVHPAPLASLATLPLQGRVAPSARTIRCAQTPQMRTGGFLGRAAPLYRAQRRQPMADMRLIVAGAGGRMGRTLIHAIAATDGV